MSRIVAKKISKSFYYPSQVKILEDLDFQAEAGETIAIMGRSGEGKSTLLHILGTIEDPCRGTVMIDGNEVSLANKTQLRRKNIGFIFQSFHLLEDFSVLDNILFPARIAREETRKGSEHYVRALDLLEKVGLSDRAHFLTRQLSGGEKQRCAIARALCNDPEIILADEPSGNLDAHNAEAIHELLLKLATDKRKTLVIVTHHAQLADLCQKKYQLSSGRLINK